MDLFLSTIVILSSKWTPDVKKNGKLAKWQLNLTKKQC